MMHVGLGDHIDRRRDSRKAITAATTKRSQRQYRRVRARGLPTCGHALLPPRGNGSANVLDNAAAGIGSCCRRSFPNFALVTPLKTPPIGLLQVPVYMQASQLIGGSRGSRPGGSWSIDLSVHWR